MDLQGHSLIKLAELLHLTQATVSYRLKTLEQEMGAIIQQYSSIHLTYQKIVSWHWGPLYYPYIKFK